MKKILLSLLLVSLLVLPLLIGQQTAAALTEGQLPTEKIGFIDALEKLISILSWILYLVAAICIIIAGFYFVTAAGDPEKVKTARNFVIYAAVGVIVALLATGLVKFLVETFTKKP